MQSFPAPDKPFPILDRIVLKHICGGHTPFDCTDAQWFLRHSDDKIYHHRLVHYSRGIQPQIQVIHRLPDAVLMNPGQFVMVHIPHDSDEMKELSAKGLQPGYVLDDQLKDRYGLKETGDYAVYHVHHPKKGIEKVAGLFRATTPDEYTIVLSRAAFAQLATGLLERLRDLSSAKEIFNAPSAASLKLDYQDSQNPKMVALKAVIHNAGLSSESVANIMDQAVKCQQFEFAGAMREVMANLFPNAGYKHRDAIASEFAQRKKEGGRVQGS